MKKIKTSNLIIINDEKNKILLFKRAKNDEEANKWSFVGGTVEEYESFEDTLRREIKEEINCNIEEFSFFKMYSINNKIESKYFIGKIKGEIKLDYNELSEYKWFNLDENILNEEIAFNQNEIIKDLIKYISDTKY